MKKARVTKTASLQRVEPQGLPVLEAKAPNFNAFMTQPKKCGETWINTVFWKTSRNPRTTDLHYGLILKRYSSDSESNSDSFSTYNI